jgi:S1-C subfamily serine protease
MRGKGASVFRLLTFLVFFISFISFSHPASAASYSEAEKLVKAAEVKANQLKQEISIEYRKKKYPKNPVSLPNMTLYKETKSSLDKATKAVSSLSSKQKTALMNRLNNNVKIHYTRATYYIDAINTGEKIVAQAKGYVSLYIPNAYSENTKKSYQTLTQLSQSHKAMIKKVYGASTQQAISQKYNLDTIINNLLKASSKSTKDIVSLNDDKVVLIETNRAQGSGVVVAPGLILTNHHVISDASEAEITLNNGAKYEVEGIVEANPEKDIALIKTKSPFSIKPAYIGNSSHLAKGDKVVAIGSPQGFQNTVSEGIVSGFRIIEGTKYIQTNAPIDHGSSGGGLFNTLGQLVGITTSGYEDSNANLNFAVASEDFIQLVSKYQNRKHSDIKAEFPIDNVPKYSNDDVLEFLNNKANIIPTRAGNIPIHYEEVFDDEDGKQIIATIAYEDYLSYLENYDVIEADVNDWAKQMGQFLDEVYPDEQVFLWVWYVDYFTQYPSDFPAEEITKLEDGTWELVHNIIRVALTDKIYWKVIP